MYIAIYSLSRYIHSDNIHAIISSTEDSYLLILSSHEQHKKTCRTTEGIKKVQTAPNPYMPCGHIGSQIHNIPTQYVGSS